MRTPPTLPRQQRGALLILLVIALGVLAVTLFVGMLSRSDIQAERDKTTAAALAEAKAALIGYAAGTGLSITSASRPGDLPCPDLNNDGIAETSCGNASGTTGQIQRIGRLPWKTLGLPDLRDGDGERLWYAVSNNYKKNIRTTCSAPGQPGCLNSDSQGTITIRDSNGLIIYDGSGSTGAVAVVISPGAVLQRQGAVNIQDRSCTIGTNCDTTEQCTTSPASLTPKCNPVNYLDTGNGEDNADFLDGQTNGFINGKITVADPLNINNKIVIVNDRLVTITTTELLPLLEKRVAGEVMKCLTSYSAVNSQRYSWAAKLDSSAPPDYADATDVRFGRIPDSPFTKTQTSSSNTMSKNWPAECNISSNSGWWLNWKEMVFYSVADAYKPSSLTNPPASPCLSCLTVNPPSAAADKRVVVIVAGKTLLGTIPPQSRAAYPAPDKGIAANYLEGGNESGMDIFTSGSATTTFNDRLLYK